jgi:hypothetical protein
LDAPQSFRGHEYSKLEMSGMHLRKVVRALVRLRRDRGQAAGNPAGLTMVTVDIAAAIVGARLSERRVENMCVYLDFRPDPSVIARLTEKARREISTGAFSIMPSKLIGKLLDLTAEEKWTLASLLHLQRICIEPIDHADDVRRRKRASASMVRVKGGAVARDKSAVATARAMGISRATLYRRMKAGETVSWKLPEGATETPEMAPEGETLSWTQPGERDTFVDAALLQGTVHKTVSPLPVPGTDIGSTRIKRTAS